MLFIILPVHNRIEKTRAAVADLCRQTRGDWHLLLIDDGSTDGTAAAVTALVPDGKLTIIRGDGKLWWAGALQQAWLALRREPPRPRDAVLILNDDVTIAPDFLASGLACLDEDRGRWLQAIASGDGAVEPLAGIEADLVRLRFRPALPGAPVNCLSTRGLLLDFESFRNSGGFRPRFLPHYLSDYEFTLRAHRRGIRLGTCERFWLKADLRTTGIRSTAGAGIGDFLAMAFDNRHAENPFRLSLFVLLCCPWWSIPANLLRLWYGFSGQIMRAARNSLDHRVGT
jgi:GT2 family glycosyltransferase